MSRVEVNGQPAEVQDADTILSLLKRLGISVPTLCHLEGLEPTGGCRLCVVEIEGWDKLQPACATPLADGMRIWTHSPRVISARRTNLELLLSHHDDDCLYCSRSRDCRLRQLAVELGISLRRFSPTSRDIHIDKTAAGFLRDPSKCILCGRCIRVCDEIQSVSAYDFAGRGARLEVTTPFHERIAQTGCVRCGQCLTVCPTGALADNHRLAPLLDALSAPEKIVTIQIDPAVVGPLAEQLRIPEPRYHRLVGALRAVGFDRVFDTTAAWTLLAEETARELKNRKEKNLPLPLLAPLCPAADRFLQEHLPEHRTLLSELKNFRALQGSLIKSVFARQEGITPDALVNVALTPCLAQRDDAEESAPSSFGREIDSVLSLRDIITLFSLFHIDFNKLLPGHPDHPFAEEDPDRCSHGKAGDLATAIAGAIGGQRIPADTEPDAEGPRIFSVGSSPVFRFAVIDSLAAARRFFEDTELLHSVDLIEISACPGGCHKGAGSLPSTHLSATEPPREALSLSAFIDLFRTLPEAVRHEILTRR